MSKNPDLSLFPFFSGISRDRLAEIEAFSIVQNFEKGAVIFHHNESARNLYGLIQGDVDLSILFREEIITKNIKYEEHINTDIEEFEKPIIIEKVKKPSIFGWSALVEPEKMTATARCASDCEIVLIPASDLKQVFNSDSELGYLLSANLNSIIAQRLHSRTAKLVATWCSLFETERISTV
ncbi:MAG: cyclic nucleotide-binding domain-containing protein [Desulfobacula sp.]|nr:cyclic nucleotide-binding domain-containing protein [Desulfobacula sp.]